MKTLKKKIVLKGTLECLSGLHIGGNGDGAGIGDVDNPVIRNTIDQVPYVPGSSLKGKIRSLLQIAKGESHEKQTGSDICKLFGAIDGKDRNTDQRLDGNASRIIVRDAFMTEDSKLRLASVDTDMPYTELKSENRIDRIKGVAEHPRQIERVPAGTVFGVEIVLNIFEGDDEQKLIDLFKTGVNMLHDDYLGGSGSRGSGRVKLVLDWQGAMHKTTESYFKHD